MGVRINKDRKPTTSRGSAARAPRLMSPSCPKVSLKPRAKKPKPKPLPTPQSSVTLSASIPMHIEARLRAFADRRQCTIGSAVSVALDLYLPPLEED